MSTGARAVVEDVCFTARILAHFAPMVRAGVAPAAVQEGFWRRIEALAGMAETKTACLVGIGKRRSWERYERYRRRKAAREAAEVLQQAFDLNEPPQRAA